MLDDFFSMGGYGFYVWSAWGLSLFGLAIMTLSTLMTRRRLYLRIERQSKRQARLDSVKAS